MAISGNRQSVRSTSARMSGVPAWWKFLLAGLGHAVLSIAAFPPVSLWPIALVAPLPLIWAGCRSRGRLFSASVLTAVGVMPLWVFQHMYLINVTAAGYPVLCVYLSLYAALFVVLLNFLLRIAPRLPAAALAPLAWVALELLRGEVVFTGYPWFLAGQALIDVPVLAVPASILSVYGLSLPVVAVAAAAVDATGWSGRRRSLGGLSAGVAMGFHAAFILLASDSQPGPELKIRVAVIQTNLPQDNKVQWPMREKVADFRRFLDLTLQAGVRSPRPDVILWPETMFPGYALNPDAIDALHRSDFASVEISPPIEISPGAFVNRLDRRYFSDEILKVQAELGIPFIVGAIAADNVQQISSGNQIRIEADARYNAAFLVSNGAVQPARYDKLDLTPFGEFMPYLWRFPQIEKSLMALGAGGMQFDLAFGRSVRVLEIPIRQAGLEVVTLRVATPICFEGTKPRTCRRLAMDAPQGPASLLVNLSNDGWFADFPGREAHLQASRWRCVELGLPMVRAVNTGISAVIDRNGRIVVKGPDAAARAERIDGVMSAEVVVHLRSLGNQSSGGDRRPGTVFARWGFLPLGVVLGVLAALLPISRLVGRSSGHNVDFAPKR